MREDRHKRFARPSSLAKTKGRRYRISDIPLRRIGTPKDAGRAILALVSPLTSYVTGQVRRQERFTLLKPSACANRGVRLAVDADGEYDQFPSA